MEEDTYAIDVTYTGGLAESEKLTPPSASFT